MAGRNWKICNILFLFLYLLLSSTICLFHTDSPLGNDPLCPACNFQNSALAITQTDLFQLPVLSVFEILQLPGEIPRESVAPILSASRSPPLV